MIKKRQINDIGDLNKYITLQKPAYVSDGAGGRESATWVDFTDCWAAVKDIRGTQYTNVNGHTETVYNMMFVIRYNPDVASNPATDMRVVYNSRAYRIRNILNLNQSEYYLGLACDGNDWEAV